MTDSLAIVSILPIMFTTSIMDQANLSEVGAGGKHSSRGQKFQFLDNFPGLLYGKIVGVLVVSFRV